MSPLRLFFAIDINEEVRHALTQLISQLRAEVWGKKVHWVKPKNLHITLRFIGQCDAGKIPALVLAVQQAISDTKPFSVELDKVCLLPSTMNSHAIILNMIPSKELFTLAGAVETAVTTLGFSAEKRPYFPHITLARIKKKTIPSITKKIVPSANTIGVDKIVLLNSEDGERDKSYKLLKTINFQE